MDGAYRLLLNIGDYRMREAIEIIEKQLLGVRNKLQGARGRITASEDAIATELEIIEQLEYRELELISAITKLRN